MSSLGEEARKLWEASHVGDDVASTFRRMVNIAMRSYGLPVDPVDSQVEVCNRKHLDHDDPYYILGVTTDDPVALVHDVYRVKVRHLHPDNKKTGNAERFQRVEMAYRAIKQSRGIS